MKEKPINPFGMTEDDTQALQVDADLANLALVLGMARERNLIDQDGFPNKKRCTDILDRAKRHDITPRNLGPAPGSPQR
jgi:hypothetical protein